MILVIVLDKTVSVRAVNDAEEIFFGVIRIQNCIEEPLDEGFSAKRRWQTFHLAASQKLRDSFEEEEETPVMSVSSKKNNVHVEKQFGLCSKNLHYYLICI